MARLCQYPSCASLLAAPFPPPSPAPRPALQRLGGGGDCHECEDLCLSPELLSPSLRVGLLLARCASCTSPVPSSWPGVVVCAHVPVLAPPAPLWYAGQEVVPARADDRQRVSPRSQRQLHHHQDDDDYAPREGMSCPPPILSHTVPSVGSGYSFWGPQCCLCFLGDGSVCTHESDSGANSIARCRYQVLGLLSLC